MSKIDAAGMVAFSKWAEKEQADGRSAACTGNFDKACTFCRLYWDCPYMRKEKANTQMTEYINKQKAIDLIEGMIMDRGIAFNPHKLAMAIKDMPVIHITEASRDMMDPDQGYTNVKGFVADDWYHEEFGKDGDR